MSEHPSAGLRPATTPTGAAPLKDPVCGMSVSREGIHHAVHEGAEYWFCSAQCRERFIADPTAFLPSTAQHAAPSIPPAQAAPAPAGTKYTCPMHPQIIRDAPGACPICGMALV